MHFSATTLLLTLAALTVAQHSQVNSDDVPPQCLSSSECQAALSSTEGCARDSEIGSFEDDDNYLDCVGAQPGFCYALGNCEECVEQYMDGGDIAILYNEVCAQ